MIRLTLTSLVAGVVTMQVLLAEEPVRVRVTGDNVNLRAAATTKSEVVGQVSSGDILVSKGSVGGWMRVHPPESINLWVYSEFLSDGKVAVSKLQLRAGPGINYKVVGQLKKGQSLNVTGSKGDWTSVAPPSESGIWISSDYVEVISKPIVVAASEPTERKPPMPVDMKPPPVARPEPVKVTVDVGDKKLNPVVDIPSEIAKYKLVKNVLQGQRVKLTGTLTKSGYVWKRPSKFRLVEYDKWERAVSRCYIIGSKEKHLNTLKGAEVYVVGKEYWVQGVKYPIVIAKQIIRND